MKLRKPILLAMAAALATLATCQAATVTAAGTLTLTPTGFATGTDVANFDTAGVGTDGFVVFNSQAEGTNVSGQPWDQAIVTSIPAYVTALDGSASASSGGWANYDDVTVGGTNYNTGGLVQSPGAGAEVPLLTFQLIGTVPSVVTLGVLSDNSDSPQWTTNNIRITGSGGGDVNQSLTVDGAADLLQFDITGGVAGETYTAFGTQAGTGGALIGGLSFDSIPEPSGLALLGVAGLALIFRRRK